MDVLFNYLLGMIPPNTLVFLGELAILAYLYRGIQPQLADLTKQVKYTNGSVTEIKAWREGHDKQDNERHEENTGNLRDIRAELHDILMNQRRA